jgi:methenyltetrahydrofolate cyclohydrolase
MLIEKTVRDLVAAFAAPEPTPGGGSAAALAGAVGSALLSMVAGLPTTRHGSEADRTSLAGARERLCGIIADLSALLDEDAAAYDRVMAAYRRPRGTDEEKAARRAAIQEALTGATDTPLRVMARCREALGLAAAIAAHGNPSAASDLQVGIALLSAGLDGARLNVEVNLDGLKDQARVTRIRSDVEELWRAARASAERAAAAGRG